MKNRRENVHLLWDQLEAVGVLPDSACSSYASEK